MQPPNNIFALRGLRRYCGVEKHVARCAKCRDHLEGELGWAAAMRSPFMAKVRKMIDDRKKAAKA